MSQAAVDIVGVADFPRSEIAVDSKSFTFGEQISERIFESEHGAYTARPSFVPVDAGMATGGLP